MVHLTNKNRIQAWLKNPKIHKRDKVVTHELNHRVPFSLKGSQKDQERYSCVKRRVEDLTLKGPKYINIANEDKKI